MTVASVQDQGSVSMSVSIHPMSLVDPKAQLGAGVKIGPFCEVGPDVVLGEGVELFGRAVFKFRTRLKLVPQFRKNGCVQKSVGLSHGSANGLRFRYASDAPCAR